MEGVKFRNTLIDPTNTWQTADLVGLKSSTTPLTGNLANCWGAANAVSPSITVFRLNVLHLLPKLYDANNRWTGKRLVNDSDLVNNFDKNGVPYAASLATAGHSVTLREGQADQAVQTGGGSLVVIYRTLNPNEKLRRIALYDGSHLQSQTVSGITQSLAGFYDNDGPGRMTMLVGSGNPNSSEVLTFNGAQINQVNGVPFDPFPKTGSASDRSWAFPTFDNLSMAGVQTAPGFGEYAETALTQSGGFDCKSWAAVIFSTPVLDADHDGLPDAIEASSTSGGQSWKNPDGEPVPDLHAMGAQAPVCGVSGCSGGRQDIFAEINALQTTADTTYGSPNTVDSTSPDYAPYDSSANPVIKNVTVPAHDHTPGPDALQMAGDVFWQKTIAVHFDVGNTKTYFEKQFGGTQSECAYNATTQLWSPHPVCQYLVPSTDASSNILARGGETILEDTECVADPDEEESCQFPYYAGTVGWKFGLERYRDSPVQDDGTQITTDAQFLAWQNGTVHRTRFDLARRSMFHYVLLAHARAKPKSMPCLH